MNHGSLFSGIGGFDLAAEWMGWNNIFHCEWNEFGQKVLKYHFPKSISHGDITKTDFTVYRGKIDIITGGFPCQPYSNSGKRLGKEDERHLWPEMLRAIREIQPTYVVGENVSGIISWNGGLVFDEVQTDLEAEGYEVQPFVLPACAKDAPHRRDRVWFIAYSDNARANNEFRINGKRETDNIGRSGQPQSEFRNSGGDGAVADTKSGRRRMLRNESKETGTRQSGVAPSGICGVSPIADTSDTKLQRSEHQGSTKGARETKGQSGQLSGSVCGGWEQFPTESPIRGGNDGIPERLDGITVSKWCKESIKAYGNAIVPQVAHEIFKAIERTIEK